jgi:putative endopeptidase
MIRSAEWFHAQEMQRLNDPAADRGADLHPGVDDDAEYDSGANEARIQRPVSAPGWRDQDLDDAFVYGATLLAHEVAHALDSEGRHYDADGLKRDWWTSADAAAFDQRAAVLAEQYSGFEPLPGRHINGKASLRENMADLVGLRIALDAFKQTAQFKAGRRVGGFTPLQRFFLAYAYAHAGQMRPEALASSLNGPYAPDRERVNGVLMNIPEFYEAFGVKPGDAMYRSESARVSIW